MTNKDTFIHTIKSGYTFQGETIKIGAAILDGEVIPEAEIFLQHLQVQFCVRL